MGLKQRREREKQALREGILDAARQIARTEGWPAVTIRKIADQIEYSPPMVYEYFASKEDLLLELLREGFRQLSTAMQRAFLSTSDEEERFLRIGDAYCQFAQTSPELYQVMHGLGGIPLDTQERMLAVQEVCRVSRDALIIWAQARGITLADPDEEVKLFWAMLHGLVSLFVIDRPQDDVQLAKRLARLALQRFLKVYQL
jgi:AcrR family transcriptional regulator